MQVMIVTSFAIPHVGGASTHIELLAAALKKRRMFHDLISRAALRPSAAERARYVALRALRKDRARVYHLHQTVDRLAHELRCRVPRTGDVVLHCHDPLATCAALRSTIKGAAVVQTVHGPWSRENQTHGAATHGLFNQTVQQFEREAFGGAQRLIAVDHGQAAILHEDFAAPSARVRVISNAVDTKEIRRCTQHMPAPEQPSRYVVVPRRLVPKNGVEFAIRALAACHVPTFDLVIAGDGPLRADLQALARTLGVAARVRFLGDVARRDLFAMMHGSVAVVVPSVPAHGVIEATSLAVLEAMAVGVPVIGSAIGGIAEIITHNHTGLLVPPGDPQALASAMQDVAHMPPPQRAALTTAAAQHVEQRYGAAAWADQVGKVYREALDAAR